ncbi:MAG: hypothetical protein NZ761_03450, partial [Dehalococcoidia bacterium]|nr:hypothetical protein [Dehalococcoidia bacterium]
MATLAQIQLQIVSDTRGAEEGLRRVARLTQMVQSARDRVRRGGTVDVGELTRVANELQRIAQGYDTSARAAASGAQRVSVAMQQKAAATRQAGAQIREVVTIMDTMTARFSRVLEMVVEFGLALAAWGAVQTAIGGVANAAVNLNAKLEQTTVAWTALTGSQEKARLIIEQINLIAAKTP